MTEPSALPSRAGQADGEQVLVRWRAGRTQGSRRLVAGHLYLTTRRLVFAPNALEAQLNGAYYQTYLSSIVDLGRQPKDTSQLLGGSIRDRVWVEIDDRSVERFRVKDIDEVVARISAAARQAKQV